MISEERLKQIQKQVGHWIDPTKLQVVTDLLEALIEAQEMTIKYKKAFLASEAALTWCVCECVQHRGDPKPPPIDSLS